MRNVRLLSQRLLFGLAALAFIVGCHAGSNLPPPATNRIATTLTGPIHPGEKRATARTVALAANQCVLLGSIANWQPGSAGFTCGMNPGSSVTVGGLEVMPDPQYAGQDRYRCSAPKWVLGQTKVGGGITGSLSPSGAASGDCGRVDTVSITLSMATNAPGPFPSTWATEEFTVCDLVQGFCTPNQVASTDSVDVIFASTPTPAPSPAPSVTSPPPLQIWDTLHNVNLTAIGAQGSSAANPLPVMIGQHVALGVITPSGDGLQNPVWETPFPGTYVGSYDWTQKVSAQKALTDFSQPGLSFFWTSGAGGGVSAVRVSANVGGTQQSATAYVQILSPTVNVATLNQGTPFFVTPAPSASPPNICNGGTVYACLWSGFPGAAWTYQVTTPPNLGAGQIAIAQTLHQVISFTNSQAVTSNECTSNSQSLSKVQYWLDNGFPYPGATPAAVANGAESPVWASNDAPNTSFDPTNTLGSRTDAFKDYFVYRPAGDSIWVTLELATWQWSDSYTYNPTTGVYTAGTPSFSHTPPAASTKLPSWASTAQNGIANPCT